MIDPQTVREALSGPVGSIRTPFLKDGSIDLEGLRAQINFNIKAGSKTVLLTAGDSHYVSLSEEEIAHVTRVAAEHAAERAMVVAADRHYPTGRAVEFARYCREVGAHVLMLMPPDWASSCTAESLAAHYAAVARHIPVMLVTNVFKSRGDAFALNVIRRALETSENIVAVKDDLCGRFARRMALLAHDRWAVISGGQKQNHLDLHPYGCDGYLSTFITFRPEITRRYWGAIREGDIAAAASVVRDVDMPFFDLMCGCPGGFDAGIHAVLELVGRCRRWRRPPYYSLNDTEMDELGEALAKIGAL